MAVQYGSAVWQCNVAMRYVCIRCEEGYEDVVYKRPAYVLLIALFLTQRLVSLLNTNLAY